MALSIKNDEADRLARELSEMTGESITEAIVVALRERLANERLRPSIEGRLRRLLVDIESYPIVDTRSANEILGYDHLYALATVTGAALVCTGDDFSHTDLTVLRPRES